jgi:hypothetical protein
MYFGSTNQQQARRALIVVRAMGAVDRNKT